MLPVKNFIREDLTDEHAERNPSVLQKENEKGGTVVRVDYVTKTYDEKNETLEKYALVYLPYGYDESKKYPVFYMLHGGGGVMEFYFHTDGSSTLFKNYLDNMMANWRR